MTETFKLVKETSTRKYEVSNLGTIRINGHVVNRESICHKFGGKDQDYWYNGAIGGYLHRIVALNFVDNPDPIRNTSVTFIDGDKDNITVNNLRWSNITEINKKSVNVRRTTSLASMMCHSGVASPAFGLYVRTRNLYLRCNGKLLI